jgi:H+/Cl- antiporter ClcA
MSFRRTKILTLSAVFGFVAGTVGYFVFTWFVANDLIHINLPSVSSLITSPWFIAGTVGALISAVIVILFARITQAG